jgi:hypothetical protein
MADRPEPRQIVVREDDATAFELGDGGADVVHTEAHRSVFRLGTLGLGEERNLAAAATVDNLPVEPLLTHWQRKRTFVKVPRPGQIADRQHHGHLAGIEFHGLLHAWIDTAA